MLCRGGDSSPPPLASAYLFCKLFLSRGWLIGIYCLLPAARVPIQMKLITASMVSERLKINVSLARAAIQELKAKGTIREVSYNRAQGVYTRVVVVKGE